MSSALARPGVRRIFFFLLFVVLISPLCVSADTVVPTSDVTARVVVRAGASAQTADVGSLRPGESAELLGSVSGWYHVRLSNHTEGYVSKRWTNVITAAGGSTSTGGTGTAGAAKFTVDAVDVGTGLAILVRGQDFTLVYDAGSNDDMARGAGNRMLAYMKAVAPDVHKIDFLILSHPHQDHVELMADLFGAYEVKDVFDSGAINQICGYRAFIKAIHDMAGVVYHDAAQSGGTKDFAFTSPANCYGHPAGEETVTLSPGKSMTEYITNNQSVQLGQNASMKFLHVDGNQHSSDFNANSTVVRLDLGSVKILLAGDGEAGGRKSPSTTPTATSVEGLLLACCASDLSANVLVVGHHGSMTSSRKAFLDKVGASVFIVSAGPTKYGSVVLPDAVVITELQSRGKVFRTDLNDAACKTNPAKIGPDNDGEAGGCDNVRLQISATGDLSVDYWRGAD